MSSAKKLWQEIIPALQTGTSLTTYNMWFKKLVPLDLSNGTLVLGSSDELTINMVNNMYNIYIIKALLAHTGQDMKVITLPLDDYEKTLQETSIEKAEKTSHHDDLNPRFTFEEFVIGSNSEFAYAAALAVAEKPYEKYNPLFLYGETGLGKTHLLHAIGNHVKQKHPDWKIMYITSEQFSNEFVEAIVKKSNTEFREKYRNNVDLLLIDDVQFFAKKERMQEEFFHTFNELKDKCKQIVLTSDRPPKDINPLEQRLRTRLEGGLMADISHPDYETRLAILKKKLEFDSFKIDLPADVLDFIATKIQTNIRELEGAIKKIVAYHEMSHKSINLDMAMTILKDYFSTLKSQCIDTTMIIGTVENYFNISNSDIKGKKRDRRFTYPRQIAMYICRELTGLSYPQIGVEFGGRDHSTVHHSVNKIKAELETNLNTLNLINKLIDDIKK